MKVLAYVHTDGCGKPAFIVLKKPEPFDTVRSEDARHVDGRRIENAYGTPILCDGCGCQLEHPLRVNRILERELPIKEIVP